ncbi:alpha 2 macroglobulin [Plakobranchus ocellatus]|uniref:Alpha 2 macroglobulin n=1 Tax=Plakobranchus ocellatus TaxID=259542 RepID=A0AAV4CXT4_9GAST|nr:alpha 2 macroglobulin [Plakobranchus ocellatus]
MSLHSGTGRGGDELCRDVIETSFDAGIQNRVSASTKVDEVSQHRFDPCTGCKCYVSRKSPSVCPTATWHSWWFNNEQYALTLDRTVRKGDNVIGPIVRSSGVSNTVFSFPITFGIKRVMSPKFTILVYYVREDGEVVADSMEYDVEICFTAKIFDNIGEYTNPWYGPNTRLYEDDYKYCLGKMKKGEGGVMPGDERWRYLSEYVDALEAFKISGSLVMTDRHLESRPCRRREKDEKAEQERGICWTREAGAGQEKWRLYKRGRGWTRQTEARLQSQKLDKRDRGWATDTEDGLQSQRLDKRDRGWTRNTEAIKAGLERHRLD